MMKKVGSVMKKVKSMGGAFFPALACTLFMVSSAFADPSGADTSAMTTAFTAVKTDFLAAVSAIAPIAIAVVAAPIVWKLGIRFFRTITSG